MTARYGARRGIILLIGTSAMLHDTKRVYATGGMHMPIAGLITVMSPKWMGSIPSFVTIGSNMGTGSSMADVVSRMVPTMRSSMFMNISIRILLSVTDRIQLATFMGICPWFIAQPKIDVVATQNMTIAVMMPL